jgi:hypothetical protein
VIIEVKDWRLASLEAATPKTVTLRKDDGQASVMHPREQGRATCCG